MGENAIYTEKLTFDKRNIKFLLGYGHDIPESKLFDLEVARAVYEIYERTNFDKVMYLYKSGPACIKYFDMPQHQEDVLVSINTFCEQVDKIRYTNNESFNIHAKYCYYMALSLKETLASHMDFNCETCIRLRVHEPSLDDILKGIRGSITGDDESRIFYRLLARFMMLCDELEGGIQMFNMIYEWFKEPEDLFQSFATRTVVDQDILDPRETLKDIHTVSSELMKSYYYDELDPNALTEQLKYCIEAAKLVKENFIGDFNSFVDWISVMSQFESLARESGRDADAEFYLTLRKDKINQIRVDNPDNEFIKMIKAVGIEPEYFIEMANTFIEYMFEEEGGAQKNE